MRFRYFDPMQQSVVEGQLSAGADVAELVGRIADLGVDCSPALEIVDADGTSIVLGVDHDRAVVLWTTADGTTRHSIGGAAGERAMFDYFGARTQMPGHYAVPLATAVTAAGSYVDRFPGSLAAPALPMALD
ncbi:MAG: Imm1 family immunity protein [Jatrophihabitans sp.]